MILAYILNNISWKKETISHASKVTSRRPSQLSPEGISQGISGIGWAMPSGLMTSAQWWSARYSKEIPGDLWGNSMEIAKIIHDFALVGSRVLEVGGGGCDLSVTLASNGFSVVSIDIADAVTSQMNERYPQEQWPNLTFVTADALILSGSRQFEDGGFDIVIDKGGIHDLAVGPEAVARNSNLPRRVVQELTSQFRLSGGQVFFVSRYSEKIEGVGSECEWDAMSPVPLRSRQTAASFVHIARCAQKPPHGLAVPNSRQLLMLDQIATPAVHFEDQMSFFVLAEVLKACMQTFLMALRDCKSLTSSNSDEEKIEVQRLLKELRMAYQFPQLQRQHLATSVAPGVHAWVTRSRLALETAHCPTIYECAL